MRPFRRVPSATVPKPASPRPNETPEQAAERQRRADARDEEERARLLQKNKSDCGCGK